MTVDAEASRQNGSAALLPDERMPARAKAARATAAARWATGIVCILIVALIWSFASVLVQYIFLDSGFFRPFFLTYVANSLFVINLPVWRATVWLGCSTDPHARNPAEPDTAVDLSDPDVPPADQNGAGDGRGSAAAAAEDADSDDAAAEEGAPAVPGTAPMLARRRGGGWGRFVRRTRALGDRLAAWTETGSFKAPPSRQGASTELANGPSLPSATASTASAPRLPAHAGTRAGRVPYVSVLRIALMICPIWFGANLAYITSLALTSVTSSTIISTTSSLFTFALSVLLLDEQPSAAKIGGVSLCMAGNVLTALADRSSSSSDGSHAAHAFFGDVVCLLGAILYGLYTVLIRRLMPDEARYSLALFFGLLGAANGLALLPVVVALHFSRVEPLDDLSTKLIGMIVVKGLFDNVLSDFLWAKAIVLTSPTAATVGLSLTIPIAMATDAALHGIYPSGLGSLAALFVCAGFIMINAASSDSCGASGSPCAAAGAAAVLRRVRNWQRRPRMRRDEPLYAVVNAAGGPGIVRGVAPS